MEVTPELLHQIDVVNVFFEIVGSLLVWFNVHKLWNDREVKGVYWPVTAFTTLWCFWCLIFYYLLGQWYSLVGCVFLCSGEAVWVAMAIWFSRSAEHEASV